MLTIARAEILALICSYVQLVSEMLTTISTSGMQKTYAGALRL